MSLACKTNGVGASAVLLAFELVCDGRKEKNFLVKEMMTRRRNLKSNYQFQ